jgi:hypothetical protein
MTRKLTKLGQLSTGDQFTHPTTGETVYVTGGQYGYTQYSATPATPDPFTELGNSTEVIVKD